MDYHNLNYLLISDKNVHETIWCSGFTYAILGAVHIKSVRCDLSMDQFVWKIMKKHKLVTRRQGQTVQVMGYNMVNWIVHHSNIHRKGFSNNFANLHEKYCLKPPSNYRKPSSV